MSNISVWEAFLRKCEKKLEISPNPSASVTQQEDRILYFIEQQAEELNMLRTLRNAMLKHIRLQDELDHLTDEISEYLKEYKYE
jgi:hypothetical protein